MDKVLEKQTGINRINRQIFIYTYTKKKGNKKSRPYRSGKGSQRVEKSIF